MVNRKTVSKRMRMMGIEGISPRAFVPVTTIQSKRNSTLPYLVKRLFDQGQLNRVWMSDITNLRTREGWLYLCVIRDGHSRRVLGCAMDSVQDPHLVERALRMAYTLRGGLDGVIFHSDHGSVYTSLAFGARCTELGVTQSMGAVGTSADNALAESFNSTMKREVLRERKVFANPLQCRQEVFRWCIRYNTRRRHSWCRQISPDAFEAQSATLSKAA